jgi:hypothetical protein
MLRMEKMMAKDKYGAGYRPPNQGYGPFEAFSIKPNGEKLRTFHHNVKMAKRRLDGNPRHSGHKIVDHRPTVDGEKVWVWLNESGQPWQKPARKVEEPAPSPQVSV